MRVRARNIHQLAVMIQEWLKWQGDYYDGDTSSATIDGRYNLTSLAEYIAVPSRWKILKALLGIEKLPYEVFPTEGEDFPSEEAAIPWASSDSEACNVWSGGHPINQRCQLIKGHKGPHRGDKGAFTV